jgi:uncharacterized membrane protein YjgN (DUF898 family)
VTAAPAADGPKPPEHRIAFDGTNADLWPMSLSIALLNVVTLFFYRFWGRTRVRQYLWAQTSLLGDRFAYTGTGKEMFIGFMIVLVLIILPIFAISVFVSYRWPNDMAIQVIYVYSLATLTYFLFYMASYRALRYRLSRTNWRGIRGTQAGSSLVYALKAMGWLILTGLSMGLTYPIQRISLTGMKFNNAWFGDRRFTFESAGRSAQLYGPFMRAWAGFIFKPMLILILFLPVIFGLQEILRRAGQPATGGGIFVVSAIMWGVIFLGWLRTYARYKVREAAIMAPWVGFGPLRFTFNAEHKAMFRLLLGNILLTFLTLGFARPIAQKRSARFIADHLRMHGEPDLETLRQNPDQGPGMGEGLADAFDAGSI